MKKALITLAIITISTIGNMSHIQAKDTYYKNDEINSTGEIIRTTVCKGKNEKNLIPTKQLENKYDDNGTLTERTFSIWNTNTSKWIPVKKYQYKHTQEGKLQTLSYSTYNKSKNEWISEKKLVMYIYNIEGKLVATHYLEIEDKEDLIFASNFSIK